MIVSARPGRDSGWTLFRIRARPELAAFAAARTVIEGTTGWQLHDGILASRRRSAACPMYGESRHGSAPVTESKWCILSFAVRDWRCDALQPECGKAVTTSRNRMWYGASCAAGIILSASTGRWQMPGPFTTILTANRNYWREGLESKEETSGTKFCCRSRAGAA
jgi:hypothetical protein